MRIVDFTPADHCRAAPYGLRRSPSPRSSPQAAPAEAPKPRPKTPPEDNSIKEENVLSHVALETHGAAKSEEGYAKIMRGDRQIARRRAKGGIEGKRPPDGGLYRRRRQRHDFKFDAMLPVDAPADAKLNLDPGVSLAQTPSGKALALRASRPL